MRDDKQLLVLTHLSQLLTYVTGFGGLIVPLIIWATQKDKVLKMDAHGKQIINFQISIFIYAILCIPAVLLLGLGIIALLIIGVIALVFPVLNAIKTSNGEPINYPLTINFIK
ncbi:DUF4870 domain-containing protein [Bizionia sediminis]|uniref:DUF4870 domain-containing protein n=1 Tax=Bizionia sediminis TaxID=1737064 RepID=A0ABW5KUE8_9FLAO